MEDISTVRSPSVGRGGDGDARWDRAAGRARPPGVGARAQTTRRCPGPRRGGKGETPSTKPVEHPPGKAASIQTDGRPVPRTDTRGRGEQPKASERNCC